MIQPPADQDYWRDGSRRGWDGYTPGL